jgi:tetratricopeptide (TPR) repeat protein
MSLKRKKKFISAKGTTARPNAEPPQFAGASSSKFPTRADSRWIMYGICIFLAAITWLVFGQTLWQGFINYDDDVYVYENAQVMGGLTLKNITWVFTHYDCNFYHPLTMLSLMLDHQLYGLHAGGYHLTNLLIHAASVILLFLVLRQMTGALWRSAFVAAVFAVHPLRVESVAWVAERKDVLGAFFFMLALGAYVRYVRKQSSLARYLMVVVIFELDLLCKPTAVTLPFVLLLLDYWPLQRFEISPLNFQRSTILRLILEKIPLLALAVAAGVVTYFAEGNAVISVADISMPLRIGNALISYVVYLCQMVWPTGLSLLYSYPVKSRLLWESLLAFLVLAVISAGALLFWRKRPWFLVGWLWYLGMMVPMIGIIVITPAAHGDRFTYLPQIGLYVLLTWATADLCATWHHRRLVLGGCSTIILVALVFCAHKQTSYWRNNESLWTHTLACTTGNFMAHNNLGIALFQKGNVDEAIAHYQQAIRLKAGDAEAHINLGIALFNQGRTDDAISEYQIAIRLKPDDFRAHHNLGIALDKKGQTTDAISQFMETVRLKPDMAEAHESLGSALLNQGQLDAATSQFLETIRLDPNDAEAHYNLGTTLDKKGHADAAISEFQQAARLNPDNAVTHYNLGNDLLNQGRIADAISQFKAAIRSQPDYAEAHNNLGSAFNQQGQTDEAIGQFQAAIRFKPDYPDAHYNLGVALLNQGQTDAAISQLQETIRLIPDFADAHNNLGVALAQQNQIDAAITQFQEAIRLKPDFASARDNLTRALQQKGGSNINQPTP